MNDHALSRLLRIPPRRVIAQAVEFDSCCGHPPAVTEYRPGCYGAQCLSCGVIIGNERQLDITELREAWNRAMKIKSIWNRATKIQSIKSTQKENQ